MNPEKNLKKYGIVLPDAPKPVASYVPCVKAGNLIFVSGQLPVENGKIKYAGKVGKDISLENGKKAAEVCVLNALSHLKSQLRTLNKIKKIVQVQGFVNCAPDFTEHPKVVNGASNFLVQIFGKEGKHSRFAVGVSSLPLNACLEIALIVQV